MKVDIDTAALVDDMLKYMDANEEDANLDEVYWDVNALRSLLALLE